MAIEASFWPMYREQLERLVKEIRPDVIHAHFGPAGVLIGQCAGSCDVPFVVSFHGFDAFHLPRIQFWREKYSELFIKASCLTVVSNGMADHLVTLGSPEEKIKVVRVGKRISDYPYDPPDSSVRDWISVGRLVEKKGFDDCISAFQLLVNQFPGSTLTIIGGGELFGALECQIKAGGLENSIHMCGGLSHDEVKGYMEVADAFLLCSKEAKNGDREGVPTVLMEAQSMGLPVVATRHSGIPEVIPEANHKFLAPEGDISAIAEALIRLASCSVAELVQLAERGRTKVEHEFNLTHEIAKLRDLYTECSTGVHEY